MTLNIHELKQIKEVLDECRPNVEDFSWGPSLDFAQKRRDEARKLIKREIRQVMIDAYKEV